MANSQCTTTADLESTTPNPRTEKLPKDVTIIPDVSLEGDKSQLQRPTKLVVYKRIYKIASRGERLFYLCGIIFSAGSGTILPLMTLIFGNFVTIFTDFSTGGIEPDKFKSQISHYTLYFVYLFIAKFGLSELSQVIFAIVSTRVTSSLRQSYLQALLHHSIEFHETHSSSGAVSLALSSHCNAIQSGLADKFGLSLQSISTVFTAFVVAFTTQWKLTLVTATIIPATVLGVGITAFFDSKLEDSLGAINADATTAAEEILGSIRTVLSLCAADKLLSKYKVILNQATAVGHSRAPILGIQTAIYMFMIYAGYALAFWYGIHLFAQGEAKNSGNVITTLFSIIIGTNSFSQLASYLGPFLRVSSAGAELFVIIHKEPQNEGNDLSVEASKLIHPDANLQKIKFDNVSFSYPLRPGIPVLKNFTLSIPAGQLTALVGPSGSGKSTVIGLLDRWYDINSGRICIGNVNINDAPIRDLRKNIGIVQQEPTLFSETVLHNILHGLPEQTLALLSDEEKEARVVEACKLANAHDFVISLPLGYNTFVGNKATLLSGGQKQRLAIARAVINNPPILILDEATSALDPVSECIVQNALDRASANRTTISIAHRLSTIRHAHQIVVMDHGSIIERGTHDELSAKENGAYRRLLAAQALLHDELVIAENVDNAFIDDESNLDDLKKLNLSTAASASEDCSKTTSDFGTVKALWMSLCDQKHHWILFIVFLFCCVIGGALFPLQAYFYSQVVSSFQFTGSELLSRGNFWALMFFVLAIIIGVAYFAIAGVGQYLGANIGQYYRFKYIKSMAQQPISFFDDASNSSGSLVSKLSTNPDAIISLTGPNLGVITVVGTSILSTTILSLVMGWKLALVAIFGALPFVFCAGLIHESMEHQFEETVSKTFADSVGFASECIQAIKTVKSLDLGGRILEQFSTLLKNHCAKARNHAIKTMVWFALCESIDLLCMALAFWYGGQLLASHDYTTAQFFVIFVAIVLGSQSSGRFFAHSLDIMKGVTAYNSVRSMELSILEEPQSCQDTTIAEKSSSTSLIEFKNASFAYPARPSQPVLRGLNLKIKQGQFIALVGPSGCGKSTILGLLERFYDLNGGTLEYDGIDVSKISRDTMRSQLSLVSQEPVLYQGTIRENVLLGTSNPIGDSELDSIAHAAQIHDLIGSLPEGYNTQVGSRGTALSGGQKQRVAIARCIAMRKGILLLDEATSALDSESETLVHEALRVAGEKKTIVAVAHRLSTIQHADVINVLKDGRVSESGTHQELLQLKGLYYQMCQNQGLN